MNQKHKKFLVAMLVGAALLVGYFQFAELLTLDYLATQEASLRSFQQQRPLLTYLLAFLVYVAVTGLSIPGATALSLLYAWFFGFARSVVLISFASTAGATVAFLLSRYLFRAAVQNRFSEKLQQFNTKLQSEGPLYLFAMRLIPAIPFFVINVVMGLTPIKTSTFWWVSQLGMLPGTLVYAYAGSSVPTLSQLAEQGSSSILTPKLIAALAVLGLFPIVARLILARWRARL